MTNHVIPAEAVEAAALIVHTFGGVKVPEARERAQAILEAAAPHMHATVTTLEELEALPLGSVILDREGLSLHKNEFLGWRASNGAKGISQAMLAQEALPAKVLHVGGNA